MTSSSSHDDNNNTATAAEKDYMRMVTITDQIRYEFTNQDTIAVRKGGAYGKAVGNSAVMLKMLGAKTKLRSSYNKTFQQEIIEMDVHISAANKMKDYLVQLSSDVLRDDDAFLVVRLKNPFSSKHVKAARNSATVRSEVSENILSQGRNSTPLTREVREIFKEVSQLVRNMKNSDGIALGYTLLQETLFIQRMARIVARTDEPTVELLSSIDDAADDLQGTLLIVPNFEQEAARLAKIGRSLVELRKYITTIKTQCPSSTSKKS